MAVSLKPDYETTLQRFEAWWQGELLDRPPTTIHVKLEKPAALPEKEHASLRDRWLDVEFQVERAIAGLQNSVYLADHLPVYMPNVGPEITATLLGCELEFSASTSWSTPIVHDPEPDWPKIIGKPLAWDNPYWQAIESMTDQALHRNEGRYIVGLTDLHDNWDTMAALREPQELLMDMMDCPELVEQVGRDTVRVFHEAFKRLWGKIQPHGLPCTTWTRAISMEPWYPLNCDFWCMVNNEQARELIMPDVKGENQVLTHSIFHLDGPEALRHLDLLLEWPALTAVQWVFGAGNGPAAKWLEVYRRCLDAGKRVQVLVQDAADGLKVLEALGPKGLWLSGGGFASREEAEAYLRELERATVAAG